MFLTVSGADEVKWGLRFPNRYATRALTLRYEKNVQDEIKNFVAKEIEFDYLDNKRNLNLDLTLREAEFLYRANPEIKEMANSGELQALHDKCASLDDAVEKGYVQVMDQLDRVLQQVQDQEQSAYTAMCDEFGVDRVRMHDE